MTSSLEPLQMARYAETARARALDRRHRLAARRLSGLALVQRAAARLKTEFGAGQVSVFGSVLNPRLFHERSDVDLAVWGLDERLYLRALAALLDLDPEISVDLVEAEQAAPELLKMIERDGLAL
jgi:predicted nucleotidyltransferase